MTPVSHALLPTLLCRRWISQTQGRPTLWEIHLVAFCGVLPDILSPHWSLDSRHASLSHTVYALGTFAVVFGIAAWRIRPLRRLSGLCLFAYAFHLACDLIAGGINPFFPLHSEVFGGHYLPFWAWLVSDGILLFYVYVVYRWIPLRRSLAKTPGAPSASL